MTTDLGNLKWFLDVDCNQMSVEDFAIMIGRLENIGYTEKRPFGDYSVGMDEKSDVQIYYYKGAISLFLNEVYGFDMPEIMRVLTDFGGLRIREIFHEALSRRFRKKFDSAPFAPQMLNEYAEALKAAEYDYKKVWEAWEEESGFTAWCAEVYEDD